MVTCSFPGNPSNGATVPRRVKYGVADSVSFQCDDGYVIEGRRSASCGKDGSFTSKLPNCQRKLKFVNALNRCISFILYCMQELNAKALECWPTEMYHQILLNTQPSTPFTLRVIAVTSCLANHQVYVNWMEHSPTCYQNVKVGSSL